MVIYLTFLQSCSGGNISHSWTLGDRIQDCSAVVGISSAVVMGRSCWVSHCLTGCSLDVTGLLQTASFLLLTLLVRLKSGLKARMGSSVHLTKQKLLLCRMLEVNDFLHQLEERIVCNSEKCITNWNSSH